MEKNMKILVINLGATSSKIAVYEAGEQRFGKTIAHTQQELKGKSTEEQQAFRKDILLKKLREAGYDLKDFSAAISRGGPLKPVESGTYLIDDNLEKDAANPMVGGRHASCLGILIAYELAKQYGFPAYIADPVSTDEMRPEAHLTGVKGIYRASMFHALNQKAMARKAAAILGKAYEDVNLIGVHMGGGVSVAAHRRGRVIDNFNTADEGSFSMDRPGSLPTSQIIELCFSGEYTKQALREKLLKRSGVYSYLETTDFRMLEAMIDEGNETAKAVYEAMVYQQAKCVGSMAAAMNFEVDAIFLTGGIAYSRRMCADMRGYVEKLAPVLTFPGENEMESLAECARRVLEGGRLMRYGDPT